MLLARLVPLSLLALVPGCAGDTPTDPAPDRPAVAMQPPEPDEPSTPPAPTPPPPAEQAEQVLEEVTVVESKPVETESAFDSNHWNSAVGLGGGAGGRYGGRGGKARDAESESYASVAASGFLAVEDAPLSTFAADVDTASFTNVARMLRDGELPPADAVRVEEFVNACRYAVPRPGPRETFAVASEVTACPWTDGHRLVRLSVATAPIETDKLPPCNLVFLIDVSGSMRAADKLPLLQQAFGLLSAELRPQDRVAIVTYASGVRVALEPVAGSERARILEAVQGLQTRGGTDGAGGIQRAYELAKQNLVTGVNRVILATDGDFNIGIRSADELEAFIAAKKDDGVFLSVLGFGTGNLKDDRLERLANRGNGVYSYVDSLHTARRLLVEELGASLMTVAKDVKLQAEWNPKRVARYRLLGYENRALEAKDFRDDAKDGGEVGAGHVVTALYQVEPREAPDAAGPLATLRIRYKPPEGSTSREVEHVVPAEPAAEPTSDGRLAATAAAFAMCLRAAEHDTEVSLDDVVALAQRLDPARHRELTAMVARAVELTAARTVSADGAAK